LRLAPHQEMRIPGERKEESENNHPESHSPAFDPRRSGPSCENTMKIRVQQRRATSGGSKLAYSKAMAPLAGGIREVLPCRAACLRRSRRL
jgi:hypothetical protein